MHGQSASAVGSLLSDFLLGPAREVAEQWPQRFTEAGGVTPRVSPDEARHFVQATAKALATGDVSELAAIAAVDEAGDATGAPHRLDLVLQALDALRRTLAASPEQQGAGADTLAAVQGWIPTAFAEVSRRLAGIALATAERRAEAATAVSVGITVHELRRPLTIMSSYSQLLLAGSLGALSDQHLAALRTMSAATETLMRLVDGLAAVARLEDTSAQPPALDLQLADVIAEAVAEVSGEAELKGTRVESEVDERLVVNGDREQLVLALTNMLSNAVKHSPAGDPVQLRAARENGVVHLAVTDRGPGFPPDEAEHLFDKYYRAQTEKELGLPGSGLGLYIVRAVAERHGGQATARLVPGGGAEFELTLPTG